MCKSFSRIYYDGSLKVGACVQLDQEASHYLMRVLRVRLGAQIYLFNGDGLEYQAQINAINKREVSITIVKSHAVATESSLRIHLGLGISKGDRMDYAIQKAVELGVAVITPLITERCNVRLDPSRQKKRLAHWQAVAISACEQSGRCVIPKMDAILSADIWLAQATGTKLVCDTTTENKLSESLKVENSVAILIGPEGGLSNQELALAKQNHFQNWSLGPRTLRTETAPVVALSLLQAKWGDLK